MSRQRSRSPNYRFPWEDPGFDPHKIVAHLKKMPTGQGEADYRRGEDFSERRHSDYQQHKRHSEENYHRRRSSPYHEPAHFKERGDGPKRRETYRENTGRYEDRRGPPQHKQNYPQRDPGWRRDQGERESKERYRDRSPIRREGNQQRGRGQQGRKGPIHTDTWSPGQDNPELSRSREMDGSSQFGYGWKKPREQRFSADDRRDGFDRKGPLEFQRKRNNPIMDPMEDRPPPRRDRYSHSREGDFSLRPRSSRSMSRESLRGGHFEENHINDGYREPRRSPITHERPTTFSQYTDRPTNRGRPSNRGRGFNRRGAFNCRGRGRGAHGNRPQQEGDHQNAPNETRRGQFMEEEFYDEPEPAWDDAEPDQEWRDERRSSEGRRGGDGGERSNYKRQELEMQQRPQELRGHNKPKTNMMVITEETLTIKVDMSRPVNKNSAMLYSADRQLSLDLVHVGRQRLDFLTTSESSRLDRENAVQHTGTFAQEIITLTHLVKDLYFGGEGITLNERFSAPQKVAYDEEEPHEMTLSERFGSNRLTSSSQKDSDDPLFVRQGPLQLLGSPMVRDPDDLRHDLEKRRQERLEGVKVTIAGQSQPQHPPVASTTHNSEQTYGHSEELLEEANWSEEPQRRQEGQTGPRRGGPFRSNGPFRRNNRQMRRPNYRNNNGGSNW